MVVPFLSIMLFGLITFGEAFNQHLELTAAASASARLLAISRGQTSDPCGTTAQALYAAAPNLTHGSLSFSYVLNATAYTGTSCSGAQSNLVAGQNVQVAVTYPCSLKLLGVNLIPNCKLTAQVQERVQ